VAQVTNGRCVIANRPIADDSVDFATPNLRQLIDLTCVYHVCGNRLDDRMAKTRRPKVHMLTVERDQCFRWTRKSHLNRGHR